MKRKTHGEFSAELRVRQGDRFLLLGEYTTAKEKIEVCCTSCGTISFKKPHDILKGSCQLCHNKKLSMLKSKTHEEFYDEVKKTEDYELLDVYKNSKDKVKIIHKSCKNVFYMSPAKFSYGQRCPKCFRPKYKRTHEDFLREFNLLSKGEYSNLEKFKTVDTKIKVKHNKCGFIYEVSPHKFINQNRRCPKCAGNIQKTHTEFLNELNKKTDQYEVISKYKNSKSKIEVKHKKCGKTFFTTPCNLNQGKGCPFCNMSKGEAAIEKYLFENGIKFEKQYKIEGCKKQKSLPFDFAVFKGKNKILIEYQGEQHYKPVSVFGGEKAFLKQIERDQIKFNYCIEKNIKFIAIPYYEFENIPYILKNSL